MTNRILLFYLLLVFGSCSDTQAKLSILENEDKVVDILVDMYIAEATLNKQPTSVRDSLRMSYRDNIILIHHISDVEFDSLFLYVQTDMVSYKDIHKRVVSKLNDLNSNTKKE